MKIDKLIKKKKRLEEDLFSLTKMYCDYLSDRKAHKKADKIKKKIKEIDEKIKVLKGA